MDDTEFDVLIAETQQLLGDLKSQEKSQALEPTPAQESTYDDLVDLGEEQFGAFFKKRDSLLDNLRSLAAATHGHDSQKTQDFVHRATIALRNQERRVTAKRNTQIRNSIKHLPEKEQQTILEKQVKLTLQY
jgi:hypothetical protein